MRAVFGRLLALCAIVAFAAGAAARAEPVTIQLAIAPGGHDSVLFLALSKGWFKEAGLDVDIRDGRGSVDTIQLVGAGQVDVGFTEVGTVPLAVAKGAKIKVIAQYTRKSDLGVIVDANSPVHVAKDLKGLQLDVFAGSPWVPYIDTFTKNAGLNPADIKSEYVDPSSLFATYMAGRVDGIWGIPPYSLPMVNRRRPSRGIDAYDYGIVTLGNGFTVSDATIATRAEMLGKLVHVVQRAWAYMMNGHEDECALAVQQYRPNAKVDLGILRQQAVYYSQYVDTPSTVGKPLGWQSEEDWSAAVSALEQLNLLKPGYKPSDFYTNQFIDPSIGR
jgi:NitT/TauT family transport system substrate-binding protein